MRLDLSSADRNASVRSAARAWRTAGAIDAETLGRIEAAYPDDRVRVGIAFRVLLCVFTLVAGLASFLLFVLFINVGSGGLVALALGLLCTVLTELQTGRFRRAGGGTDDATSFLAVCFLIGAMCWLLSDGFNLTGRNFDIAALAFASIAFAAGAWRWGYPLYAGIGAVLCLLVLAHTPQSRILWMITTIPAYVIALKGAELPRLPPAHRRSCAAVLAVSVVGFYLAVNVFSFDHGVVESLRSFTGLGVPAGSEPQSAWLRLGSIVLTALVPAALVVHGVRSRRRLLLALGALCAALSLTTIRAYYNIAPTWVALILAGVCTIVGILALRRYLDSGPEKERGGFTAEGLFDAPPHERVLELAATVAVFSPAATARAEPGFKGGGGESGGGGASSSY